MLVLSRKVGEEVLIDNGRIRIKFLRHGSNGCVKLGFEAPPDVRIYRLEAIKDAGNKSGEKKGGGDASCSK